MKNRYGYGDKIFTADDLAQDRGYENKSAMWAHYLRKQGKEDLIDSMSKKPTGESVDAFINQSRIMARCDVCGNVMAINLDDSFLCMQCFNYQNKFLPRPINYPKDILEIMKLLEKRTTQQSRNWMPGDSVKRIKAENKDGKL